MSKKFIKWIKVTWENEPRPGKIASVIMLTISALELIASAIIWIR